MIGSVFGKWTIIEELNKPFVSAKSYKCICQCGSFQIIKKHSLKIGKTTQCRKCAFFKHGMAKNPVYKIWSGLLSRCYNKKVKIYKYYGGRGITVCDSWLKFENFYKDMGDRPIGLQIDRIDNDKGYSHDNCRWVTAKENNPSNKGDLKDLMSGKYFGKWFVVRQVKHKPGHRYYLCQCRCLQEKIICGGELKRGRTTQCRNCKNISHRGWPNRLKNSGK